MIGIANGAKRRIQDYTLSRYAYYLIVQNCNPRMKIIALSNTNKNLVKKNNVHLLKIRKEFIKEI